MALQPLARDRDAPAWVAAYGSIPFDERDGGLGLNCWGLVRLGLRDQAGLHLPSYREGYDGLKDEQRVSDLIVSHVPEWMPVLERSPGPEPMDLSAVRLLDVVLMNVHGRPLHVGLVVGRGLMWHVERGIDAVPERFDRGAWGPRVVGIYRHRELSE